MAFVLRCVVGAAVLVTAAGFIFGASPSTSFWREFAELLVQPALIVAAGALIKLVFDLYLKKHTTWDWTRTRG